VIGTSPSSRRILAGVTFVPKINLIELRKLAEYLEECNREGRIAQLTPEWTHLLSQVMEITPEDDLPSRDPTPERPDY
jgi:MoaA/NifB/PqqE/SkfB family radical SAM enzyme